MIHWQHSDKNLVCYPCGLTWHQITKVISTHSSLQQKLKLADTWSKNLLFLGAFFVFQTSKPSNILHFSALQRKKYRKKKKKHLLCDSSLEQTQGWNLANRTLANNTSDYTLKTAFFLLFFLSFIPSLLCILSRWQFSESAWTFQLLLWTLKKSPHGAFPVIF